MEVRPEGKAREVGFGLDPTGHWLIVENQDSDSMVEFKIDPTTGELSPTGTGFELGAPGVFPVSRTMKIPLRKYIWL